jgi:polyphosphate kinase
MLMGKPFEKPFGGAVSSFVRKDAPPAIREAIRESGKKEILRPDYPYPERLPSTEYERDYAACQLELIKMQRWLRETRARVVLVFEGRDAAGKGGTIRRVTENLNPRVAPVVALPAPSDRERGQWYFQRYVERLPTRGECVLFDRSWYNRAVVERVFDFSTEAERARFYEQLAPFESTLVHDGIILMKLWLSIGRAEQLRRFLDREKDPLKQWKLSEIDIRGLDKWDEYSVAVDEMFARSHSVDAPWTVILADDKRRARIAAMRAILGRLPYPGKDVPAPDPAITGGPEILASG